MNGGESPSFIILVEGTEMNRSIIYVHGMGGSHLEADGYRRSCNGLDVIGVDYGSYVPSEAARVIRSFYDDIHVRYDDVYVLANSIGAYFSMIALDDCDVAKAFFISPVLDMKRVISDMMKRSGVSEDELKEKSEIVTSSGEVLSWEYLSFVRSNPIKWRVPTEILYAGNDSITSRETVNEFVRTHDAGLTVMENGEHWFHTEEQLTFLNEWLKKVTAQPLPVDHRQP